jgi:thermostable 8-oxoguanine DNA glycosylase
MDNVIADFGKGWVLTTKDIECAHYRHDYERGLIGVKYPLDRDMLFPAFQYSMLSAAQNTKKLVKIFSKLKKHKLDTSENVLKPENQKKTKDILSESRFPNVKTKRFFGLAEWWQKDAAGENIVGDVVKDINSNRKCKIYLRDALVTFGPKGMGSKVSSLLIQTITPDLREVEVVTVDKWMLQFLRDIGYESVRVPNYRTISGVSSKDYGACETIIASKAREHGLAPGELGCALWCKSSYTEPNKSICDFFPRNP